MAIDVPTRPAFRTVRWGGLWNTQVFTSPITESIQTLGLTGDRWMGQWTFPPLKDDVQIADWEAFFMQMEGRAGRFNARVPFRTAPRGPATGTPLVLGADQTGASLITDGWTANVGGILLKGDYFKLANGELKLITADANSDGVGAATLSIKPNIRTSPADDSAITTADPTVEMMQASDEITWDIDMHGKYRFTLAGIEAFG